MSHKSFRRNGKKPVINPAELIQVKSLSLHAPSKKQPTKSCFSDNNIPDHSNVGINHPPKSDGEEDSCILNDKLLKTKNSIEELRVKHKKNINCAGGELGASTSNYGGEVLTLDYDYSYKYFPKNTKSIKFTNQVTVLYFNGQEILFEANEPLKKELDQQFRNKEMRRVKGQDSVYLF